MSVTQLIPWNRNRTAMLQTGNRDPFFSLQREVNRLFDDMWNSFDLPLSRGGGVLQAGWPHIELQDQNEQFVLTVEVPGMDEKDIDIQFVDQCVILSGERKEERGTEQPDQHYSERYYGRFERRIPLSAEIEADKAKAVLRNGVLSVTLPKAQVQKRGKRIAISKAA